MSTHELLAEIQKLPVAERLALIESLTRGLREELQPPLHTKAITDENHNMTEPKQTPHQQRRFVADKLRGLFKTKDQPPADQEIKDDYTRFLMEKYS